MARLKGADALKLRSYAAAETVCSKIYVHCTGPPWAYLRAVERDHWSTNESLTVSDREEMEEINENPTQSWAYNSLVDMHFISTVQNPGTGTNGRSPTILGLWRKRTV